MSQFDGDKIHGMKLHSQQLLMSAIRHHKRVQALIEIQNFHLKKKVTSMFLFSMKLILELLTFNLIYY